MAKLADIFRLKIQDVADHGVVIPLPIVSLKASAGPPATTGESAGAGNVARNVETLVKANSPVGEEQQALHQLLIETRRKIDELDALKNALDRTVLPFNGAMQALDQERRLSSDLSRQLGETAATCEALRGELQRARHTTRAVETEAENLRVALESARETGAAMERAQAALDEEIRRRDAHIAALERQLEQEALQRRSLGDHHRTTQEQLLRAEKLIAELQSALTGADQKCEALTRDKRALWDAAEQARDEAERLGRRLAEGESALNTTRADLGRFETGYADVCGERNRLAELVQELREQHKNECQTLNGRIEVLQSRATATERLVAETRQRLINRTEEARAFICKTAEATIARGSAERRLAEIEVAQGLRARPSGEPAESRTALSEYLRALNLRSREMAMSGAAEKLTVLSERNGRLAADGLALRAGDDKRVEDVVSVLRDERLGHGEIESALEAARKENARLESEVASLRASLGDAANGTVQVPASEPPDAAEAKAARGIEPPKVEPSKIEPPKSRLGLARNGVRAFESMLMPRRRPAADEDDAASNWSPA